MILVSTIILLCPLMAAGGNSYWIQFQENKLKKISKKSLEDFNINKFHTPDTFATGKTPNVHLRNFRK